MKSFILATLLLTSVMARSAEPADPSAKLREQLRSALLQLRAAQTEAANARSAQALIEAHNEELNQQLAAANKRLENTNKEFQADKSTSERTIATLNNRIADREKRITEFTDAIAKWKEGYEKAAKSANEKEQERARLAAKNLVQRRSIADLESRNIALFNTATEVLDRFENYATGKALAAREPFIGTSRVRIENLVQGYKDRIIDNRIPPRQP